MELGISAERCGMGIKSELTITGIIYAKRRRPNERSKLVQMLREGQEEAGLLVRSAHDNNWKSQHPTGPNTAPDNLSWRCLGNARLHPQKTKCCAMLDSPGTDLIRKKEVKHIKSWKTEV
jgi:hypothetical protein